MARSATNSGNVLVRIRRLGDQWATCGIGVEPPAERLKEGGILHRCTKLVPGQVVELPDTHVLARHKLCERVYEPEEDEFMRPWVYDTAEQAAQSDPTTSHLSRDQIRQNLAFVAGAMRNQGQHNAELRAEREAAEADGQDGAELDDEDGEDPFADVNATRAANRQTDDIYEGARPIADDAPAAEQRPRGRQPRGRAEGPGRQSRER